MLINHSPFACCLMGEAGFIQPPEPYQQDSYQVSIAIPDVFCRLNKPRVLPADLTITGNSNPRLRVRKNIEWNGTSGNLELLMVER